MGDKALLFEVHHLSIGLVRGDNVGHSVLLQFLNEVPGHFRVKIDGFLLLVLRDGLSGAPRQEAM